MIGRASLLCCLALSVSGKSLKYPKIIDGIETTINKFPYSLALFKDDQFYCGGSIISDEWVLTAAACAGVKQVVAGQTNPFNSTKKWTVSQSIKHPKYVDPLGAHDIALLKLKEKLPLDGITMKAVKLSDANPKTGEFIDIAGWGITDPAGINKTQTLRTSQNVVFSFDDCKIIYKETLFDSDFCLEDPKGTKTACFGDFGSAAIDKNGYQVGVTSGVIIIPCGQPQIPVTYTGITHPEHREFIRKHTGI